MLSDLLLNVPSAGNYEVYVRWTSHENRATNVPVTVYHKEGQALHTLNQRTGGGQWHLLGGYPFSSGTGAVVISSAGTNGYVIADAVLYVKSEVSCGDLIAGGQTLAADISGPEGVSDCYVDMYDWVEMARQWLLFF